MAVTGVQKWPCPTCTYNNWSSSVKCVLCGCSRPNEITSRASVVKYRAPVQGWSNKLAHSQGSSGACLTQDIICADFNLPPSSSPNTVDVQPHHHHKVSGHGHGGKCKTKGGKWTCAGCTFSNWPNAGQCTMCGTQRTRGGLKHDPIISAGGRSRDQSGRTPHLSESILNYATSGVGGAVGGAACHAGSLDERAAPSSSQDALLIQPVAAKSKQNSRNGKRTSSQQQTDNINNVKKWKCHQCTYENWPRAVKCIMCQLPRRRTPSPPLSGGEERDTTHFPPASVTTIPQQQTMSRLTSLTTTATTRSPSSSSNSSSPVHSRSSSNSNETLVASQQRLSPEVSNGSPKAAGGVHVGGGGSGGNGGGNGSSRLIGAYERENWGSLEIVPSVQLKSDSDEVIKLSIRNYVFWVLLSPHMGLGFSNAFVLHCALVSQLYSRVSVAV